MQIFKTIKVLAIKMERFHIVLVSIGSKENCCFLKHLPTLVCTYVINEWSLVTLWHKSFEHTVFACKQYLVMKLRPSIDSTLGWNSFWGRFLVDFFFWEDKSDLFMLQYFVFVSSLLNHIHISSQNFGLQILWKPQKYGFIFITKKVGRFNLAETTKCTTKMLLQKLFYSVVKSIDTKLKYQPSSLEY